MNQILNTNEKNDSVFQLKSEKNDDFSKSPKYKNFFNIQLIFSTFAIFILVFYFFYNKFFLKQKENFSALLESNYNISKLYSNTENSSNSQPIAEDTVIGIIKIPKLNISYAFFSGLNDELLKISPCRFFGKLPNSNISNINNNLCIAGHNYNNDKFFSKIKNLEINDKIIIVDNDNNEYIFSVIKNYEVKFNDLSPIYTNLGNTDNLTLVTCNNLNNNRIIIKAIL